MLSLFLGGDHMANSSGKPWLASDSHITSWPSWVSSRLSCPCYTNDCCSWNRFWFANWKLSIILYFILSYRNTDLLGSVTNLRGFATSSSAAASWTILPGGEHHKDGWVGCWGVGIDLVIPREILPICESKPAVSCLRWRESPKGS